MCDCYTVKCGLEMHLSVCASGAVPTFPGANWIGIMGRASGKERDKYGEEKGHRGMNPVHCKVLYVLLIEC